ncbi:MAG: hypothetical protein ABFD86_08890, partial [Bryobacteraceae bacterium]
MRARRLAVLFLTLLLAGLALAQPTIEGPIMNVASYLLPGYPAFGVAQGSMFVVFGRNMGPRGMYQAETWPLPKDLVGTSLQVTVGGVTVDAIMVYTSATQLAAILPSNTPTGDGTISVTYAGQVGLPAPIRVVPAAFGIFTLNSQGNGPAVIQIVRGAARPVNTLLEAAHPMELVSLWGSGLGAVTGNEAAGPLPGDMSTPIEVWVGGQPATVYYRGRSGCCAGVDEIYFYVPLGVTGCYVPVVVRSGQGVSNSTTMSISQSGNFCEDPSGFTADNYKLMSEGGKLTAGWIELNRRGIFTSPTVDPAQTSETVLANFSRFQTDRAIRYNAPARFTGFGSCVVDMLRASAPSLVLYQPDSLEAGEALNVKNPNGITKQVSIVSEGSYFSYVGGETGSVPLPQFLVNGTYRVDNGSGGTALGAFSVRQDLRSPVMWTNIPSTRIDITRSDGYRVTWTGGDANRDFVTITGTSVDTANDVKAKFFCAERADAGQFTIPPYVLLGLPANNSTTGTYLAVGSQPLPSQSKVTITGLDQAYFY